jgi:glutaredoxin
MYLLFTTPRCGRCFSVKNSLTQKGIPFKEVNIVESQENLELAQRYGIQIGGSIIDTDTGRIVMVEEIIQ